jgi:hypothetical protein
LRIVAVCSPDPLAAKSPQPDRWRVSADSWQLLGINAQLLGSGTAQEEEWRWLESSTIAAAGTHSTELFLHRPLVRTVLSDSKRVGRYVPRRRRDAYSTARCGGRSGLSSRDMRTSTSTPPSPGLRRLWMPSSAFILPDRLQFRVGAKVVRIGVLGLAADEARVELPCPDGMQPHVVSRRSVYEHIAI